MARVFFNFFFNLLDYITRCFSNQDLQKKKKKKKDPQKKKKKKSTRQVSKIEWKM